MEEKKNKVGIIGKLMGKKDDQEFTAEKSWIESTYGEDSYKNIEVRIKDKQDHIKSTIKSKYKQVYQNGCVSYSSYHCVIDIEEDLALFVDTIFEPFVNSGFVVINLSEKIEEIDEPNVYLVSWKNAFKHKNIDNKNNRVELLED